MNGEEGEILLAPTVEWLGSSDTMDKVSRGDYGEWCDLDKDPFVQEAGESLGQSIRKGHWKGGLECADAEEIQDML